MIDKIQEHAALTPDEAFRKCHPDYVDIGQFMTAVLESRKPQLTSRLRMKARTDASHRPGQHIRGEAVSIPVPVALLSESSGAPTAADASDTIIPVRVVRSAGEGWTSRTLRFRSPPVSSTGTAGRLRENDRRSNLSGSDTWPTPSGPSQHLGDYVKETEEVSQTGEKLTGQSQVKPYHYGKPLRGMLVFNKLKNSNEWIDGEILFNPMVDGKVLPNQSSKQRGGGLNSYLWAHPETSQTSRSTTWQTQSLSNWTLLNAVQTLCDSCNDGEAFIRNPGTGELAVLSGAPVMHDIRLKAGEYLPHYLEQDLATTRVQLVLEIHRRSCERGQDETADSLLQTIRGTSKKLFFQMPGKSSTYQGAMSISIQ